MDIFYALAEPRRRSIIELLASRGQLSSTAISESFDISNSAISQHLKVLRDSKLVFMEKRAQQRIYQLNTDAILDIEAWARQTTNLWNGRFDSLDELLSEQNDNNKGVIYDRRQQ